MVTRDVVDGLLVSVLPDADAAADAAAGHAAAALDEAVADRGSAVILAATGASQVRLLARLVENVSAPWDRVTLLHLDEFVGLLPDDPRSFAAFVRRHFTDIVRPGAVSFLDGSAADPVAEAERYEALLRGQEVDVCLLGLGENAHLAFNEPGATDFADPRWVKVVSLAPETVRQHVRQGLFDAGSAPRRAITVTIPAILASRHVVAVAAEIRKADAVRCAVRGAVTPECPASALRLARDAALFVDEDAAALL